MPPGLPQRADTFGRPAPTSGQRAIDLWDQGKVVDPSLPMERYVPREAATDEEVAAADPKTKKSGVLGSMARSTGGIIAGVGELTGLQGVEDFGVKLTEDNPSSINNFGDVIRDPLQTGKEAVAEAVPQVGVMAGGAGLGALIGGMVGGPPGSALGAGIGGYGTSFVQELGEIRRGQEEEGVDNWGMAIAGAGTAAALDVLAPIGRVGRKIGLRVLGKAADEPVEKAVKTGVTNYLARRGRDLLVEGGTEGVQTPIERAASGKEPFSPEGVQEALVSAAKGGLGGTVVSGAYEPFDKSPAAKRGRFDPNQVTGSGQVPGAPSPEGYDTQFGSGKFGDPTFKASERTMGEVYDYGQKTLRPATRAAGYGKGSDGKVLGTSAIGKYQFVSDTMAELAEEVYGADWRSRTFSPEVQEALAERLFEKKKGGNLKAVWEGLPDATPGAYKDKTWAEMRQIISKAEGTTGGFAEPDVVEPAEAAEFKVSTDEDLGITNFDSVEDVLKFIRGEGKATGAVTKLAQAIAKGDDKAAAALAKEREAVDARAEELAAAEAELSPDDNAGRLKFTRARSTLSMREAVLERAEQAATAAARARSPQEAPAEVPQAPQANPLMPDVPDLTPDTQNFLGEQETAAAEGEVDALASQEARQQIVDKVMKDDLITDKQGAIREALGDDADGNFQARVAEKVAGIVTPTEQKDAQEAAQKEAETVAKVAEDLTAKPEPIPVTEAAPTAPAPAADLETEQNKALLARAKERSDSLGPVVGKAYYDGARLALGDTTVQRPEGPRLGARFDQGAKFINDQFDRIDNDIQRPATEAAPAVPAPAAPAPPAKEMPKAAAAAVSAKQKTKAAPPAAPAKEMPKAAAAAVSAKQKAKAAPPAAPAKPMPKAAAAAVSAKPKPKGPTPEQIAAKEAKEAKAAEAKAERERKAAAAQTKRDEKERAREEANARFAAAQAAIEEADARDKAWEKTVSPEAGKTIAPAQAQRLSEDIHRRDPKTGEYVYTLKELPALLKEEQAKFADAQTKAQSQSTEQKVHAAQATILKTLTKDDQKVLAEHYKTGTFTADTFIQFKNDVVRAINHGFKTVDEAIRSIVKKAAGAAMSLHMVFNPTPLTQVEVVQHVAPPAAEKVQAVDAKTYDKLSPNAKIVLDGLAPELGRGQYAGKAVILADKPAGRMYIFDGSGKLAYQGDALYGADVGDVLSGVKKITPAGSYRIEKRTGRTDYATGVTFALKGTEDAGGVVAIHSVWTNVPSEARAERLASETAADNRVSFGCINTATKDFADAVLPMADEIDGGVAVVVPDAPLKAQIKQAVQQSPEKASATKQTPPPPALPPDNRPATLQARTRGRQRDTGRARLADVPLTEITEQQRSEMWASLRNELDRLGLKDVALKLESRFAIDPSGAALGEFQTRAENRGISELIRVAFDAGRPNQTFGHEVVHAMRELGLFTPAEWTALARWAQSQGALRKFGEQYTSLTDEQKVEEMVSEAFGSWYRKQATPPKGLALRAVRKVGDLLRTLGRWLNFNGFRDAETVFLAMQSGEIGLRERQRQNSEGARQRISPKGFTRQGTPERQNTPDAQLKLASVERAAESIWDTASEIAKKGSLLITDTENVARMGEKQGMTAMRDVINLHKKNHGKARAFQERIVEITDEIGRVPREYRGTKKGSISDWVDDIDYSGKWAFKPDYRPKGKLDPVTEAFFDTFEANAQVDPEMAARFEKLPPAVQDIIKAIFRLNFDQRNELYTAGIGAIKAEYDPLIQASTQPEAQIALGEERDAALAQHSRIYDTRDGLPYSPAMRDGAWAVVGKSEEYIAAQKAGNKAEMTRLKQDPKHYFTDFRDTVHEAKALNRNIATKYAQTQFFERAAFEGENIVSQKETYLAFDRMKEAIIAEHGEGSKQAKELVRMARDFYLHGLSEYSALKGELRRNKVSTLDPVTGEKMNRLKAFVTRNNAMAQYTASIANNKEMQAALRKLKTQAANATDRAAAMKLYNDFMYRYTETLGRKNNRTVDKITRATSIYTLLTSPFYYLQNMTQTVLISGAVLSGRYGPIKSQAAIMRAYGDFLRMQKGTGITGRVRLTDDLKDVGNLIEVLTEGGYLDAGYSEEMGDWKLTGDGVIADKWNLIDRFIRRVPQKVEVMNRFTAGVAAYRLATEKGADHDAAVQAAKDMIHDTHGDYSGFNAPTVFHATGDYGRIALQFRKFQLIQLTLLTTEFVRMFKGATVAEKRAGFQSLFFIAAHMAAAGGIIGLPASGFVGLVVGSLLNALDDNDEDWDDWRHNLREHLGAGKQEQDFMSDLIYKGLPYAMGVDTSERLGMGNVASLFPFIDWGPAFTNRSAFFEAMGQAALGPTGGVVGKAVGALDWGITENEWGRFVASLFPSIVGNIEKAIRLKNEGLVARGGETFIPPEDIGVGEALMIAIGVTPSQLTNQSEKASEVYSADQHYSRITSRMKDRWTRAVAENDNEQKAVLREQWTVIQEARKRDGYEVQPLSTMLKAPKEQAKRQGQVIGGVASKKANRRFVEALAERRAEEMAEED